MLVDHFIGRMNRRSGKTVSGISQEALSLLMFHDYPGNIRELENIIEHAFVLCPEGELSAHCLPEELNVGIRATRSVVESRHHTGMNAALQSTQTQIIIAALKRNRYNRTATARELNMHKSTLYRKIKRMGIKLPEVDGRTLFETMI